MWLIKTSQEERFLCWQAEFSSFMSKGSEGSLLFLFSIEQAEAQYVVN